MSKSETVQEFYKRIGDEKATERSIVNKDAGRFNVYRRNDYLCKSYTPYNRRDFYKISLIIGKGTLYYANKGIEINSDALVFSNPNVPYAWEALSPDQFGYFCLFTDSFIDTPQRIHDSPFFRIGGDPVYFLSSKQVEEVSAIFEKMLCEIESEYIYKYDLLRNYINLLIHEALKLQPADSYFRHSNAAERIVSLFMELLERQFPIDSPDHILQLKTAADYATRLSVHVNHLNRTVKKLTGKTTTEHIADRIVREAKALLKHTDWNISEIAYSLGFEYPAYFNNFFKKQTSEVPKAFR
ncbi:helix-turn-helix transcriptional regulator [Chitinophagaceae bacterium 26-R-25]|nr:helix-turn-helix transcriptional regulator [Chitinophagaceae bacterium 26-R-25]